MRRDAAKLVYDSARTDRKVGLRSAPTSDRTLLFRTRTHSIDLLVHQMDGAFLLVHGQVVCERTGEPVAGARVWCGADVSAVTTDELGQFALSLVRSDSPNTLEIDTGEVQVVVTVPTLAELAEV